ncbi:MAG: hypothetical protein KatS3mg106_711 [Gemmataceae bacterium]|jgi:hypothetical protein|nr:MAG: hypothetical protein KatS3mg106_711 [Gemmataceae bacterium]
MDHLPGSGGEKQALFPYLASKKGSNPILPGKMQAIP